MLSLTVEPASSRTTSCRPMVFIPGPLASHVKLVPGTTSVTSQTARGSLGCRILAREPTPSSPPSSRSTLSTVGVHSGHFATSNSTSHTGPVGASMCLLVVKVLVMYQTVHREEAAGQTRDRLGRTMPELCHPVCVRCR